MPLATSIRAKAGMNYDFDLRFCSLVSRRSFGRRPLWTVPETPGLPHRYLMLVLAIFRAVNWLIPLCIPYPLFSWQSFPNASLNSFLLKQVLHSSLFSNIVKAQRWGLVIGWSMPSVSVESCAHLFIRMQASWCRPCNLNVQARLSILVSVKEWVFPWIFSLIFNACIPRSSASLVMLDYGT